MYSSVRFELLQFGFGITSGRQQQIKLIWNDLEVDCELTSKDEGWIYYLWHSVAFSVWRKSFLYGMYRPISCVSVECSTCNNIYGLMEWFKDYVLEKLSLSARYGNEEFTQHKIDQVSEFYRADCFFTKHEVALEPSWTQHLLAYLRYCVLFIPQSTGNALPCISWTD